MDKIVRQINDQHIAILALQVELPLASPIERAGIERRIVELHRLIASLETLADEAAIIEQRAAITQVEITHEPMPDAPQNTAPREGGIAEHLASLRRDMDTLRREMEYLRGRVDQMILDVAVLKSDTRYIVTELADRKADIKDVRADIKDVQADARDEVHATRRS